MKKKYTSPAVLCLTIKSAHRLLNSTSIATSEKRYTDESFSRSSDLRSYDIWEDEEGYDETQ